VGRAAGGGSTAARVGRTVVRTGRSTSRTTYPEGTRRPPRRRPGPLGWAPAGRPRSRCPAPVLLGTVPPMSTDLTSRSGAPVDGRDGGHDRRLLRWSVAALVANAGIVVTGGIVRVTASGLGCPTWPTCEEGSVLPSGVGDHGWRQYVEFGNRTLTAVVLFAVVGALLAARRATPPGDPRRRLAGWLVAGVAAQAVLGGVTVLLELHPLTVAAHFLLSMLLIGVATVLTARARGRPAPSVLPELRSLGVALLWLGAAVLVLGTVVTATGPHAGDPGTPRLGLPLVWVTRTHSTAVWLTVAATVLLLLRARSSGAHAVARWASALLALEVLQGAVGYWQYATAVPPQLVILHMGLACVFWIVCVRTAVAVGAFPSTAPATAARSAAGV
jgi:cytochrome c oxidase assembly protein subunit 15